MRSVALLSILALGLAAPAVAAPAQPAAKSPERVVLEASTLALGALRGAVRNYKSINAVQYIGEGTQSFPTSRTAWTDRPVKMKVAASYAFEAWRNEMRWAGPGGAEQLDVPVVNGKAVWNESKAGTFREAATPQDLAWRHIELWATPHGAIRAALEVEETNPRGLTVTQVGGKQTISYTWRGVPTVVTLDPNNRPERVVQTITHPVLGRTTLTSDYSDYRNWELYDVYFPAKIVQRLGNRQSLDLTVNDFHMNPYVVFPVPEEVRAVCGEQERIDQCK